MLDLEVLEDGLEALAVGAGGHGPYLHGGVVLHPGVAHEGVLLVVERVEDLYGVAPADLAVTADRFHLGHVLDNLVDNALKYSGERVSVLLAARRTAKGVELRVADNGIGMDRTAQAHIFEKFYRVPTGDRHDVKGFGLGLYYVRLIVTRHGGTVSVESAPGRGSTFTLILPDEER